MKKVLTLLLIPAVAGAVWLKWSDETAEAGEYGNAQWLACKYDLTNYGYAERVRIYNYSSSAYFYFGIFAGGQTLYFKQLYAAKTGWVEYIVNTRVPYTAHFAVRPTKIAAPYYLGIDRTAPHHQDVMYYATYNGSSCPTFTRWLKAEDFMIHVWATTTIVDTTSWGNIKVLFR